jgi:nucleoid-associated protein YgaU
VTAAAAALVGALAPVASTALQVTVAGGLADAGFDDTLVWACAAVAVVVTAWGWLVTVLVVVDALRGSPGPRRGIPPGVRRVVLVGCGVALGASVAAPALAAPGAAGNTVAGPQVLAGLRLPERVAIVPHGAHRHVLRDRVRPALGRPPADTVVVAPGDSLWSITARQLGPDASPAEVASAWPGVYAANRQVIGSDPARIVPGQRLTIPTPGSGGR